MRTKWKNARLTVRDGLKRAHKLNLLASMPGTDEFIAGKKLGNSRIIFSIRSEKPADFITLKRLNVDILRDNFGKFRAGKKIHFAVDR